jgi:hypothetical protein
MAWCRNNFITVIRLSVVGTIGLSYYLVTRCHEVQVVLWCQLLTKLQLFFKEQPYSAMILFKIQTTESSVFKWCKMVYNAWTYMSEEELAL